MVQESICYVHAAAIKKACATLCLQAEVVELKDDLSYEKEAKLLAPQADLTAKIAEIKHLEVCVQVGRVGWGAVGPHTWFLCHGPCAI